MRKIIIGLAGTALTAALAACSSGQAPQQLPQDQPTGPYSTHDVAGPSCSTIGPGWIIVPEGAAGQVFHIKSAYSCVGDSVTAVIPFANDTESGGKPFNLYVQFSFQKGNPDG
jgi:hypothetical protein